MGDKDKTQQWDRKTGKGRRTMAGSEIAVALEKLTEKIKKCQSRQKELEKFGQHREADSLNLARELRQLDRQSAALLAQIQRLVAGQRELEQRQGLDRAAAAEMRESLDLFAGRLEGDAQQAGEAGLLTQRLELANQQVSRKTETLEHRIDTVEQTLELYEERLQSCIAVPADALDQVVDARGVGEHAGPASGGGANVVAFKKLETGEHGVSPGLPSGGDREMLQKLRVRLESVEGLAAELENKAEKSSGNLQALEAGQDRLGARDDELRLWVEQEVEGLASIGEATWADLERLVAEDLQRDQALEDLKDVTGEAFRQIGLTTERLDTLETANAERDDITGKQNADLQDLQMQTLVATEHGRILAGKIDTLDAAWEGLAETTEWQTSQLREFRDETRKLGDDAGDMTVRADGLAARVGESEEQAELARQRLRELEEDATRLTDHNRQLTAESQRLAGAHRRLSGGAAVLLLLLIGVVAAFWAYRPQQDLSASREGEIVSLQQALDRQAERSSAQEKTLADLRTRLAGQSDPSTRLGELSALVEARSGGLADQQMLLTDFRQELIATQGSLEQTETLVERLAQGQRALADEVRGVNDQLAERQHLIGGQVSLLAFPGQSGQYLRGAYWLGQENPAHYTIQLVAAHAPKVIDEVARHFTPADTLAHYRRLREGRDWHVVLYGSYPTLGQAREALAALPENARFFGPWIRSFKSVQAELVQP